MPTRRALLSRAVALTVGGAVAGVEPTAGQSPDDTSQYTDPAAPTDVTVTGDPGIVRLTGVPEPAVPFLRALRRHSRSVPVPDVRCLAGTAGTRGAHLHGAAGTAWGSFDAASIAEELQAHTAFSPVDWGDDADAPGSRRPRNAAGGTPPRTSAKREALARSDPAAVVLLEPSRIDVVCADSRTDAGTRLARRRRRLSAPSDHERSATDFAPILGGDVVADVSLGEAMRERIRGRLPASVGALEPIVRATRQAGVAAAVGPDTTSVRYAISLADAHRADDALAELKADLAAHESASLLDEYTSETTVVADVTARTDSVWDVHGTLLSP